MLCVVRRLTNSTEAQSSLISISFGPSLLYLSLWNWVLLFCSSSLSLSLDKFSMESFCGLWAHCAYENFSLSLLLAPARTRHSFRARVYYFRLNARWLSFAFSSVHLNKFPFLSNPSNLLCSLCVDCGIMYSFILFIFILYSYYTLHRHRIACICIFFLFLHHLRSELPSLHIRSCPI